MSDQRNHIDLSQEEFDAIDRYLSGDMEQNELNKFEIQLQLNSALRVQVDQYKALFQGVEQGVLKAKLEDFHQEIFQEHNEQRKISSKSFIRRWTWVQFAAAASIVFIVTIGSWLVIQSQNRYERMFVQYFTPDPGLPTVMSSESDYEFYVAMVAYKRGEYKEALQQWEHLYKSRSESDTLTYFIGVAHLALGEEEKAIPFLEMVVQEDESTFLNESYYYLGLSLLKKGHVDKAKSAFENSNVEKSQLILSRLSD